ncbi:MAG TPA: PLP-dependent aminotransferase family protein [Chryseolinea sp.]
MSKRTYRISLLQLAPDRNSKVPLYLQLYESLRTQIVTGMLRQGQRLPSSRTVAAELRISRNMISKAFELLLTEGYVVGKVGSGTYVADLPETFLHARAAAESQVESGPSRIEGIPTFELTSQHSRELDANSIRPFRETAELDLFPYKTWQTLTNETYKEFERLKRVEPDASGLQELRENISIFLRYSRGVRCEADQIVLTSGFQQAIVLCAYALLRKSRTAWMEDPGCVATRNAFTAFDATVYPVPVDMDGVDFEYAKKAYPTPDVLYLSPAHQYPVGGTLSQHKRNALLSWAADNNVWIIEDDISGLLRYEGHPLPSLQGQDNRGRVIYIGSFNPVLPPTFGLAYMVLPNRTIAHQFSALKNVFDKTTRLVDQSILSKFLSSGQFERHLRHMRLLYKDRRDVMMNAAGRELKGKLELQYQPAGMHLVGWLPHHFDDKEISLRLHRKGIVAPALSDYTMKFKRPPALLLAFAGFHKFRIANYLQRMHGIL